MSENLQLIKKEIDTELANVEIQKSLIETTFKKLDIVNVKKAMFEGMIRGFTFKDFLQKNVYAIPFSNGYSLVTSIDYSRKIGQKSGVVGKSEPTYEEKDGKIVSCSVTIKKKVENTIGDFTAKVYFEEYYKKPIKTNGYEIKSLWDTKPRTMIAKVAEMHALRMACPEELAKAYVEEEIDEQASDSQQDAVSEADLKAIDACKTVEDLRTYYKANEGKGKEFAKAVTARKKVLEALVKPENKDETKNS